MASRIVADTVCLSPYEWSELRDSLYALDAAHWLARDEPMLDVGQFMAITKAVQARFAALVAELQRRIDAEGKGAEADEQ